MKNISNAELEVMKVIWQKEKVTSNEIINELKTKEWIKNTIRTLINRLIDKKVVDICNRDGGTYTYTSIIKKRIPKLYM